MNEHVYCPECHKQITGFVLIRGVSDVPTIFCCIPECSRCGVIIFMDAVKSWQTHNVTALKYQDPETSPIRKTG
jgi:hypothetical protein